MQINVHSLLLIRGRVCCKSLASVLIRKSKSDLDKQSVISNWTTQMEKLLRMHQSNQHQKLKLGGTHVVLPFVLERKFLSLSSLYLIFHILPSTLTQCSVSRSVIHSSLIFTILTLSLELQNIHRCPTEHVMF